MNCKKGLIGESKNKNKIRSWDENFMNSAVAQDLHKWKRDNNYNLRNSSHMLIDKIKEKTISLCLNKDFHAFKRKHIG